MKRKCVFLDRDGVLNEEPKQDYLYQPSLMAIPNGVIDGLKELKAAGYMLIVITNQAGIAKGLYSREDVWNCHNHFQSLCGGLLDDLYFAPHHPDYNSNSLLRKPGSLMLEKAIAKYDIDATTSWMVGDRTRDIQAGKRVGVKTIYLSAQTDTTADFSARSFESVTKLVLSN